MKSVLLIAIVAVAMIGLMVPSVFATHDEDVDYSNDPEYDGKTPLRFYQIFASNDVWYNQGCEDQKNSFLRSKTIQVLKMYDYLPITSKMECVKVTGEIKIDKDEWSEDSPYGLTMKQVLDRADNWHPNLTIIVLDQTLSFQYADDMRNELTNLTADGQINYNDQTIFTRTHYEGNDSVADEQKRATRTMAHEIAHFAIYDEHNDKKAVGTNEKIATKSVHDIDELFDKCVDKDMLKTCNHLWVPLTTHYGDPIEVMSPDYVMKVAESMVAPPSVQKEIVKVIWFDQPTSYQIGKQTLIEGKLVDSKNYPISGKIISIKDYNFGELVRTVTDNQGMFRYTWTPTSENHAISANFKGSDTMITTGSMLTTNLIIEKQVIAPGVESKLEPIYDEPQNISHADSIYVQIASQYDFIPSWIPKITYWYIMEDISTEEFLAIVNYLDSKNIICIERICSR
jgi:hypothetical protein